MQLISPFLHAHAFGVGTTHTGPGVHIHIDEIDAATAQDFDKPTIHKQAIPEHSIGMTTGVSEKFDIDSLIPTLISFICFALFLAYVARFYAPARAPLSSNKAYPPSAPRAPPFNL